MFYTFKAFHKRLKSFTHMCTKNARMTYGALIVEVQDVILRQLRIIEAEEEEEELDEEEVDADVEDAAPPSPPSSDAALVRTPPPKQRRTRSNSSEKC